MEYLENITDKLKRIREENIKYFNLMDRPDLVYGAPMSTKDKVIFYKYNSLIRDALYEFGAPRAFDRMADASNGCRIRFTTNSSKVIFKVSLRRKWDYVKMNLWNSSGFDIYTFDDHGYNHRTVFGPKSGQNIFAESIGAIAGENVCVFLPNYNCIEEIYIGLEEDAKLIAAPYKDSLPVIFYGNSITQGASASRSGNAMSNIVSRKLDRDIINFSLSGCCNGSLEAADLIGGINCVAIVIDYTRNATSVNYFENTYEAFYKKIRSYHPQIPIILMTSSNFNDQEVYFRFDDVVTSTYMRAEANGENTFLLNQNNLFDIDEYDLAVVDGMHYTDYGMFRVANKICEMVAQ